MRVRVDRYQRPGPGGVTAVALGGGHELAEALAVDEVFGELAEHRGRGRRPAKSRAPRRAWFLTWRTSAPADRRLRHGATLRRSGAARQRALWGARSLPGL